MTTSGPSDLAVFRRALREASSKLARDLPWIGSRDPWGILVSEVMLQQTQAVRVVEPWRRFMTALPTAQSCAASSRSTVLELWRGLGYNRRATNLHDASRAIVRDHDGQIPPHPATLRTLPGVGSYTANAVASFAFGAPVGVLDTNVGRVLARAIENRRLTHGEAQRLADALVPRRASAAHNQAMLDLGSQYCVGAPRCVSCPLAHHCRWRCDGGIDPAPRSAAVSIRQSPFEGSDRQLRGRMVDVLREGPRRLDEMREVLTTDRERFTRLLGALVRDGLVEATSATVRLAGDTRSPIG